MAQKTLRPITIERENPAEWQTKPRGMPPARPPISHLTRSRWTDSTGAVGARKSWSPTGVAALRRPTPSQPAPARKHSSTPPVHARTRDEVPETRLLRTNVGEVPFDRLDDGADSSALSQAEREEIDRAVKGVFRKFDAAITSYRLTHGISSGRNASAVSTRGLKLGTSAALLAAVAHVTLCAHQPAVRAIVWAACRICHGLRWDV